MLRRYYPARKHGSAIDLDSLKDLFHALYRKLAGEGYLEESMGCNCVDQGHVAGTMGRDVSDFFLLALRKPHLYPIGEHLPSYTEDDLLGVIELLYDHVSAPGDVWVHGYDGCCTHYRDFHKDTGQQAFREAVNTFLCDYGDGYELHANGEIRHLGDVRFRGLLKSKLPTHDPQNVEQRVDAAVSKFLRYRSSVEDRRDAVRSLADVLEFLRPKLKRVLKGDEADLFNIANNYGIRHHNRLQKENYDASTWLPCVFYVFLATIHAAVRSLKRQEEAQE